MWLRRADIDISKDNDEKHYMHILIFQIKERSSAL